MPEFSARPDLLYTRLHPPPHQEKRVARVRLLEKLDTSLDFQLTLVCAPAGYGKTTLLSQWVKRHKEPVGWLSLDDSDNEISQFIRYFLAAIQEIDPDVGALVPHMLQPPRPLTGPSVWIALINDLAASEKDFILILDDYHAVEDRAVHAALEYLIEHMPGNLHLILATRADPPINLPQLRARGQLLEIRAADLCFDAAEARAFLQDVMDLPLLEDDVAALVQKAEGWVAGLQIAATVLQNRPDLSRAVQAFTGSNRHILDYLAVEIIQRLPSSMQDFLLQTAILDDLEASLCDTVTGRNDSLQILEQLDHENQFIVPLDDDRRWYRYHRLMVEALRRRAERFNSRQLAELHHRASIWYEEKGMIEAAVDHAFDAHDLDRAARLIEDNVEAILKRSQVKTLLEWLDLLPEEQFREHPRLNTACAWALLLKGGSIADAKKKLEASNAQVGTLASGEEAVIRAMIAIYTGDISQGMTSSRRALDELPPGSLFLRSVAAGNLGMAHVALGDIQPAIQAFRESIALARDSGNIMFAVASLSNLGGLYILRGHLKLAGTVYRQAMELATTRYRQRLPVACRALLGLSEVMREWNDLEQARRLLEEALQLAQQYNETGELVMYLSLARVLQAQGEEERALDRVQKAMEIAIQTTETVIDDCLVEAALARLWLQQGNLAGVAEWAARMGFEQTSPGETLIGHGTHSIPYDLREVEWLVYARFQIAQKRPGPALETLAVLLSEAEKQSRTRRLHEILVLMALASQAKGSIDQAVDFLSRSLHLAEPEGYIRVYIDEGQPVVKLLREAARRGIQKQYCDRLLDTCQLEARTLEGASGRPQVGLVEPLSERELAVLQLLADGYTNREICERLYISLSTVKGHISNINGKLLARNRTEAVARARHAGILPGN